MDGHRRLWCNAGMPAATDVDAAAAPAFSPLYRQIKALLTQALQAGDWKPGEVIPSEADLARPGVTWLCPKSKPTSTRLSAATYFGRMSSFTCLPARLTTNTAGVAAEQPFVCAPAQWWVAS